MEYFYNGGLHSAIRAPPATLRSGAELDLFDLFRGHTAMYLAKHHVLSSRDIDDLRHELGKRIFPHDLTVARDHEDLDSQINGCAINDIGLLYFSYGRVSSIKSSINDDQCSDRISINFPISGSGKMTQRGDCLDISASQGIVINSNEPFKLDLRGYGGVALILRQEKLRQLARSLIGDEADRIDLQMEKIVDLTMPAGRTLKNAVLYAMNEMDGDVWALNNAISRTNLENYLLMQLITVHPSSFREALEAGANPVIMPRNLKRARDYIHGHAHEKITPEDLATYAGCSYRSLQDIFGKALGVSPMTYVQRIRLEGVRSDLLDADCQQTTVAEIAGRWGFSHMGRFALFYKKQFGVSPSDTLNQKK